MNLVQMRTEVLNTGFDPLVFSPRINQYLNDAQNRVARQVDYYVSEATQAITTVNGVNTSALPADFARVRSLFNSGTNMELQYAGLRDIDRSVASVGRPTFYAMDGANIHLYPTPDTAYSLTLRYWRLPSALVNDTDVPSIPPDYHYMLINYALWKCYEREDDPQTAGYHEQQFNKFLAQFSTDVKFPTSSEPSVVRGMWEQQRDLSQHTGWSIYGGNY